MENKYKVRIMRSEIRNIKNVAYGDVMYMNYGSINKKAPIKSKIIKLPTKTMAGLK